MEDNTFALSSLKRHGYSDLLRICQDSSTIDSYLAAARSNLTSELAVLVDFFLLNRSAEPAQLISLIGNAFIETLRENNFIIETSTGRIALNGMRLIFTGDIALIYDHTVKTDSYFGSDSLGLGRLVSRAPFNSATALDLCAGPGFQSMNLVMKGYSSVTAVEINERATRIGRFNARMNQLDRNIEYSNCSAFDYLETTPLKYNTIIFNPPLIPLPPDIAYSFVGHGGMHGIDITENILRRSHNCLSDDGIVEFIGCSLHSNTELHVARLLDALPEAENYEKNYFRIGDYHFGEKSKFFKNLCATITSYNENLTEEDAWRRMQLFMEETSSIGMSTFFARWSKSNKATSKTINAFANEGAMWWPLL